MLEVRSPRQETYLACSTEKNERISSGRMPMITVIFATYNPIYSFNINGQPIRTKYRKTSLRKHHRTEG